MIEIPKTPIRHNSIIRLLLIIAQSFIVDAFHEPASKQRRNMERKKTLQRIRYILNP